MGDELALPAREIPQALNRLRCKFSSSSPCRLSHGLVVLLIPLERRAHAASAFRLRTKKPGAIRPGRVLLDDQQNTQDSVTCVKRLSTLRAARPDLERRQSTVAAWRRMPGRVPAMDTAG